MIMKKIMLTFVLAIAAGVWNWNWASDSQISSLPDEWNVLKYIDYHNYPVDTVIPFYDWSYRTRHYYLKDDTTINSTHYTKAFYENEYIGALRENDDASKVFGIPVNQTHEYLLYDNRHIPKHVLVKGKSPSLSYILDDKHSKKNILDLHCVESYYKHSHNPQE